jgi:YhcH/YjgK/YiaL family protein
MIVTDLEHITQQTALSPRLKKALEYLEAIADQAPPDGRVDLDDDRIYALIQSYSGKETDPPLFEAHRRYIDVQYIVSGREQMGWAPLEAVQVTAPYEAETDALLGTVPVDQASFIRFRAGEVCILYPADAHAPGLADGAPTAIKKIVIKVQL